MMHENQMPSTVPSQAWAGQLKDAKSAVQLVLLFSPRQLGAHLKIPEALHAAHSVRSEVNGKFITNKLTNKSNFNTKMCICENNFEWGTPHPDAKSLCCAGGGSNSRNCHAQKRYRIRYSVMGLGVEND